MNFKNLNVDNYVIASIIDAISETKVKLFNLDNSNQESQFFFLPLGMVKENIVQYPLDTFGILNKKKLLMREPITGDQISYINNINQFDYTDKNNVPSIKTVNSKIFYFYELNSIPHKYKNSIFNNLKSKNIIVKKYINEIGWREFSHSLINYFPQMLKGNLRKEFDKFPWVNNKKNLDRWKKGMTGYPIVDAGMRELYETGWMHNRIRMVVGSFLVKHLRINWTEGEKHFRNCLLDFNKANNVAQWQWVAGCGADAAPYFRIFNPILQGEKFDKEGKYVKKWIPELNKVPQKFIHKPWEMEMKYQQAINTIVGKDYPKPIVIHEEARASALKAFQSLKKN